MIELKRPHSDVWKWPSGETPLAPSPFSSQWLSAVYLGSMKFTTPITIAVVYFSAVHYANTVVSRRQATKANQKLDSLTPQELKRLPAAPYTIAHLAWFKFFVLVHNVFLCLYSAWTFVGMSSALSQTAAIILSISNTSSAVGNFFHSVCDLHNGVFSSKLPFRNLEIFGYWFYMSKFYEVLDTVIILLKGRPSSLLQSYHHAGAMMCMWAGIRYQSPPIWIFVVFNSFIHTLMYFYFSLSCLRIRVPALFKRTLTSLQITQFVIGGSLAIVHAFIWYTDLTSGELTSCIATTDQALPLFINVGYLTPLTALFAAFYIDSYIRPKQKRAGAAQASGLVKGATASAARKTRSKRQT